MDTFFNPAGVVVFGVSDRPGNLGKGVLANLEQFGWKGKRWGVGRKKVEVYGTPVYTSLDEVPGPVDVAVVLTPAPTVPDIFEECGKRGIRRIIVESSGFGEWSDETRRLEARMTDACRLYGIRFIGPNCIGTANLPVGLLLNFGQRGNFAHAGDVSVISQSGGVFAWFAGIASDEGRGINKGVSVGNKVDVDESDILDYLAADSGTGTIVMYLEDIRDGERFIEAVRRCPKPIVALKANCFPDSGAIASSHTSAMAGNEEVTDAALKQAGVHRVKTVPELAAALKGFAMPPMKGNNLAIISRSGGHAVIAADRAAYHGFNFVKFSDDTMKKIEKIAPTTRIVRQNPLDIGDVFNINVYPAIAEAVMNDPGVDGVAFIHTFPSKMEVEPSRKILGELIEMSAAYDKPLALSFVARASLIQEFKLSFGHPIFYQPENALDALAATHDWHARRRNMQAEIGSEIPAGKTR